MVDTYQHTLWRVRAARPDAYFQNIAAREIAALDPGTSIAGFSGSRWVASSLFQKAIRRGDQVAALEAGRFLLEVNRDHLFRRLNSIAAEDIALGDIEAVVITAACLARAKTRRALGGDAVVTDYLIRRLAKARKSRAADDLLRSLERWPGLAAERASLAKLTNNELRRIVLGCPSLDRKALALWYLVGTSRCRSDYLPIRRVDPALAFRTLTDLGVAPTMVQIAHANFTKTSVMLAPFVALLSLENHVVGTGLKDDPTPVEVQVGGIPSYAFDMYTRLGRASLRRLVSQNAGVAAWTRSYLPRANRVQALGELLFQMEGQCLRRRVDGPLGQQLRDRWERDCNGLDNQVREAGQAALSEAIPDLNAIRAEVVGEGVV